jgi:hypothetical protein
MLDIERKKIISVMSVLPQDVVAALKEKTGETSIKEALRVAIYHYLKCEKKEKEAAERPG